MLITYFPNPAAFLVSRKFYDAHSRPLLVFSLMVLQAIELSTCGTTIDHFTKKFIYPEISNDTYYKWNLLFNQEETQI